MGSGQEKTGIRSLNHFRKERGRDTGVQQGSFFIKDPKTACGKDPCSYEKHHIQLFFGTSMALYTVVPEHLVVFSLAVNLWDRPTIIPH